MKEKKESEFLLKIDEEEAWAAYPRGDWMLWLAARLKIDRRTLVRSSALCANTVRQLMEDKRSTDTIDDALRYADGEISLEEAKKYRYRIGMSCITCYATCHRGRYERQDNP